MADATGMETEYVKSEDASMQSNLGTAATVLQCEDPPPIWGGVDHDDHNGVTEQEPSNQAGQPLVLHRYGEVPGTLQIEAAMPEPQEPMQHQGDARRWDLHPGILAQPIAWTRWPTTWAGRHQRYLHHHKPYWYEQGMEHILHHFDSPDYHVGPLSGAWTMATQMGQCSILVTPSVRLLRALHGQPFHEIGPRPFSVLVVPVAAYKGYFATRAPVDLLDGTFACTEYAWAESKYSIFE